jgi:hypothetical protein
MKQMMKMSLQQDDEEVSDEEVQFAEEAFFRRL